MTLSNHRNPSTPVISDVQSQHTTSIQQNNMSDVRALLRAKRQEARISHPLASYTTSGQLRCLICSTLVKFASAWEGHLGSKAHRTRVARIKEGERLRDETRVQEEVADAEQEEEEETQQIAEQAGHKRKSADSISNEPPTSKKPKLGATTTAAGFPADFFSDPSSVVVFSTNSDTEDEEPAVPAPAESPHSALDLEYEKFQREFLPMSDPRETYERATIAAEPELAPQGSEGLPVSAEDHLKVQEGKEEEKVELTEEQKRQQKEGEEKELIMDRLMEEERAQEEADMKVQMMRNRLEAFKKQREAARAAKAAQKASW